jgi:hypothetical protein
VPYIGIEDRDYMAVGSPPRTPGELNYSITLLLLEYLEADGGPRYADYNEVIGVLECAKLELYRRMVAPYEDRKMKENGDVYT